MPSVDQAIPIPRRSGNFAMMRSLPLPSSRACSSVPLAFSDQYATREPSDTSPNDGTVRIGAASDSVRMTIGVRGSVPWREMSPYEAPAADGSVELATTVGPGDADVPGAELTPGLVGTAALGVGDGASVGCESTTASTSVVTAPRPATARTARERGFMSSQSHATGRGR